MEPMKYMEYKHMMKWLKDHGQLASYPIGEDVGKRRIMVIWVSQSNAISMNADDENSMKAINKMFNMVKESLFMRCQ